LDGRTPSRSGIGAGGGESARTIESIDATRTGHHRGERRSLRPYRAVRVEDVSAANGTRPGPDVDRANTGDGIEMKAPLPSPDLRLRGNQLFRILTIVIGIIAGLAAVLFSVAIDQVNHRLFGLSPSALRLFLVPPVVSLLTGVLLAKVFPDVR